MQETDLDYEIKHVNNEFDLDRVFAFAVSILGDYEGFSNPLHSKEAWMERMPEYAEFMLYAEVEAKIVGTVFGFVEGNNSITVSMVATDEKYRHCGIASTLLAELESRALLKGYHLLVLGAVEPAEGFYLKCGYKPYLFIQTHPPLTLDDLRSINDTYDEAFRYDDGIDIRLCIDTDGIDKELQHKYNNTFNNCYTNTLFMKRI